MQQELKFASHVTGDLSGREVQDTWQRACATHLLVFLCCCAGLMLLSKFRSPKIGGLGSLWPVSTIKQEHVLEVNGSWFVKF